MYSFQVSELGKRFDANRTVLPFANKLERDKPLRVIPGLETGQLFGIYKHEEDPLDALLSVVRPWGVQSILIANYFLEAPGHGKKIKFRKASEIRAVLEKHEMNKCVISAHCIFYALMSVLEDPTLAEDLVPPEVLKFGPKKVHEWVENYILQMIDLAAELDIHAIAMFWGLWTKAWIFGGYAWKFNGKKYILEGLERFPKLTERIRQAAVQAETMLLHELHPQTGAICARDFALILMVCDYCPSLGIWPDDSHTSDGEDAFTRTTSPFLTDRSAIGHIKNFIERPGHSKRIITEDWSEMGKAFSGHAEGVVNLRLTFPTRLKLGFGHLTRYLIREKEPVVAAYSEAEDWNRGMLATPEAQKMKILGAAEAGVRWCAENLSQEMPQGLFTDDMGAGK